MSLLLPRKKKIEDTVSLTQPKAVANIKLGPAPKPVATYSNNPRQSVPIVTAANQSSPSKSYSAVRPWHNPVSQGGINVMRDAADFIGSGFQQGLGKTVDVAVKGGNVLSDFGIRANPLLSNEQKDQQLAQQYANTEAIRNRLKGITDLSGRKVTGTSDDISLRDIKSGDARKISKLAGESLDVGLTATQFINPTQSVLKPTVSSFGKVAKPILKEAGTFGTGDAIAAGAQTYGETGDVGQSLKNAATTGAASFLMQGGMLAAGHGAGNARATADAPTPARTLSKTVGDAEKVIQDARLFIDEGLDIPADIQTRLNDEGITAVNIKETPYGAEYDPDTRAINIRDQASATPDNLFHELGHDTFINRLTPEERAVFADSRGAGYNQAKGRKGYTAEDLVSEDFSNMYVKALKGEINSIPKKYRATIAKYAKVALQEAEQARPGGARELVQAAKLVKSDLKPRVEAKTATVAPTPEMTRQITPANALSDQQLIEAQQLLNRPKVKGREAPNIVKEDGTVIGKTADLADRAESTPQPPGTVRLYQGTENGVPSPNYFDNIGQLENYYKYRSDGVDLQFVDVPADRAKRVAGKKGEAGVYEIDNNISTSIDPVDPFNNRSIISKVRNELGSLVDSDAQMITMLRKIEKETGQKGLLDQWYFDSGNVRASKSIANAKLKNSEQLQEAFRGLNKNDLNAFDDYIAARAELMNYDGKNTSRSVAENEAIVRELAPEFEGRFAQVNSYYKELAQDMYDGGLIGEEQLAKYLSSDDYVRIQRDMEDLLGAKNGVSESRSIGTSKAVQKRKGSQREVLSPSLTIAKRTQEIELEIQRNKAANNIIDVLERSGLAQKTDNSVNKNTVSRIVNGKREVYEVAKDVKEVIDNVSPYQLGIVARVLSAPARLFRAGTTALSAPFTVTNYLRDQASSAVYSKQTFGRLTKNQQGNIDYIAGTHDPQNIIKGLASATKDFGYGSNDKLWKKFEMYAGDQTIYDELRNARNTKQMLREVRLGKRGKYANMVQNPIRTLEDLNSITEKATRFQNFKGTYEAVLRETGNEQIALQKGIIAARQNSVDFMRNSAFTRAMNLFIPYFNASVQGSRNVARSFRDRPVATAAKSIAFVALPAIAMELYNYSDEDRRKVYESLDQYEKDNNFIIVGPNPVQTEAGAWEGIYKIPKPQGYRELMQPAVDITRKFAQDEDSLNIEKMFTSVASGLSGPFDVSDPQKFVSGLIPQMAKPFVQQGMNKDLYTGNNIVPDFMQEETDDPTKRAFKSTSGTARLIANQLGVSPIQVEKFITDVTGSLGRYGINASDNALATAGVIGNDQIGGRSIGKDFSRRLFEAQGELLPENKSDGRKYYETVTAAAEPLNKNEKALFDSIHPSKTNFLGESIFDENKRVSKLTRAGAYLQSPKVFEADKQIEMQNRKNGNPANPLFDLPEEQLAKVLWKDALPPGSNDPELSNLWRSEWYQDYQTKKSNYYDELKAKLKSEGKSFPKSKNPYPEASDQLQKAMTYYSSLPKGTGERSGFIKANADTWNQMIAHWNAIDNWENKERQDVGLSAIVKDSDGNIVLPFAIADSSSGSGGYGSYSSGYSSSGSSSKVRNPRQYAIDINAGGTFSKPTVTSPAKSKVAGKYTSRKRKSLPKVTIKKSKV